MLIRLAESVFSRIDLTQRRSVLVGVSGGSDSTALLFLLHSWLRASAPRTSLMAATIDHGLRPESAAEARSVAALCASLAIPHRIRRWEGEKPATGLAAAAREARYHLLAEIAAEAGTDLLFTGHTANDQAETVQMRRQRGDGGGLAGMAGFTLYRNRIWIVRPLLRHSREELRAVLEHAGIGWIDDPSNENARSERIRVRKALNPGERRDLVRLAEEQARKRVDLSRASAEWIAANARIAAPGLIRIERDALHEDSPGGVHALRALLACCGGRTHLPGIVETRTALARMAQGCAALSRTLIAPGKHGVFLHRELRDLPDQDGDGLYDHRFRIPDQALRQGWRLRRREEQDARLESRALQTIPIMWHQERSGGDPPAAEPLLAPFDRFLPAHDLELAGALAKLFGSRDIPVPPSSGKTWTRI